MNAYPFQTIACPLIDGYSALVDMGVLRSPSDTGHVDQRRRYKTMPTVFNVSFVLPVADLDSWLSWMNAFAYDWFEMPLVSYKTLGDIPSTHVVRVIAGFQMSAIRENPAYMRVSTQMETGSQEIA